ncbi:MAG TPA: hypothetical protein VFY14_00465 [Streptomyces sp.]|nr:hypothetical protein [Streptomyces sp.]
MAEYDFPTDLVDAARRFHQAQTELDALERPRFVADYPEGVAEREAGLREECRLLAETLVTHSFWESLEGAERVAARSALKQFVRA